MTNIKALFLLVISLVALFLTPLNHASMSSHSQNLASSSKSTNVAICALRKNAEVQNPCLVWLVISSEGTSDVGVNWYSYTQNPVMFTDPTGYIDVFHDVIEGGVPRNQRVPLWKSNTGPSTLDINEVVSGIGMIIVDEALEKGHTASAIIREQDMWGNPASRNMAIAGVICTPLLGPLAEEAVEFLDKVTKKSRKYRGGAHGRLSTGDGIERHHIPANSNTDISLYRGPAIQMDAIDHAKTSSFRSSKAAKEYRAETQALIDQGRFRDAVAREIRDVKKFSGRKYNEAIIEMLEYSRKAGYTNKPLP